MIALEIKNIINLIKNELNIQEDFIRAEKGTRSNVYLSEHYVFKINQNINLLKSEAEILKSIKADKIPKFVKFLIKNKYSVLIEKRLLGVPVDCLWKNLTEDQKDQYIRDLVELVFYIHKCRFKKFWSVQYHQYFENYDELLQYKLRIYQNKIFQNKAAYQKYKKVEQYLKQDYVQKFFSRVQPTLIHGDLIMHNILIHQNRFSGLIDWEFAQYGDPFYDLARVLYYQECAKDYLENHQDIHFEYDFTSRLIKKLEEKIPYQKEKYQIIRSFYFIDTIIWALNQKKSMEILSNLTVPVFP